MLKKILNKFGYVSHEESLRLRQSNFSLKQENKAMREAPAVKKPVVDVDIGDPAPSDQTARREYISRVAAFHKDVMKPKILAMVSEVRADLEKVDNTPKMDELLKGTCNALWLIYDWGEEAISEVVSYQAEKLDDEERDILKETLKI